MLYDNRGNETDKDNLAFAKNENGYFIKCSYGRFIDPHSIITPKRLTWMKVTEECFGFYLRFLETGKVMYMNQAQRSI